MYFELALISVAIAGVYWGWYFVRHNAVRMYGVMLLASAGAAALGLYGRKYEVEGLPIIGAIGVGAGACLLVIAPVARSLARRAAAAERFRIASVLLDVAELLAPGSGVADEKALLGAMREIRDGNIEQTIDALTAAKQRAPDEARLAIDERIAMLYLAAYRWDDAIAHAEAHLLGAVPPSGRLHDVQPHVALRRALGLAPPVWVELLGAYGYRGDLDQAARMLARLEDVCAGRDDVAMWLHRGRMIFLALAGRVAAVQQLIEPRRSRHMSRAARTYWLAVAHERRGDIAAAEAAYVRARGGSRGRPRLLIDQALARLSAGAAGIALPPAAAEVVARVEAEPPPAVTAPGRPRPPIAARALTGALLAVAGTIGLALGDSADFGVLVRAGASVHALVLHGEWWRLVSCVFVHIGGMHLIVNAIGLWFVARLAEDLFGSARTVAIFAVAGVAGALCSALANDAMSAGASGAIFGLLGAILIELGLHRSRHRAKWSRAAWGSIALVTVAQLGVGYMYPVTDQWAHGGGLLAGVLLGAVLSPSARWARISAGCARVIAAAFAVVVIVAAVQVVRTSIADSLDGLVLARRPIGDLSVAAPVVWDRDVYAIYDQDLYVQITADKQRGALADRLGPYVASGPERAKDLFEQVDVATDRVVPLPPGWQGSELAASVTDALGVRQRYRVLVVGRQLGDGVALATLYAPETVARDASGFFTAMIASIQ